MAPFRPTLALTLALLPLAFPPQEAQVDRYPQAPQERVLRYFSLKGRLDAGKLNAAVKDAGFELVYGPKEAASRPSNNIVAVAVPFATKPRDVERALKKAKVKTVELEVFVYRGRIENGFPTLGIGLKKIDYMLGISGEIKWCDMVGDRTQFYCVKGQLDAEELEALWRKLQRPLGDEPATLGEVVRHELHWSLVAEADAKLWKKLEKDILALDGVAQAELDGSDLRLTLDMAGLSATEVLPVDAAPEIAFASRGLWELLAAEGLVPSEE